MTKEEMDNYSEPDFDAVEEFVDPGLTEEEKEIRRKMTVDMYKNFTDDDWRHLGECF